MPYTKVHESWEDTPSTDTPITAAALEHVEDGISTAQATAEAAQATANTKQDAGDYAAEVHTHVADNISNASAVGKAVLTAADAAAARGFLGAGTSNLAIGTTAGTAKAGDYQPDLSAYATTAALTSGLAGKANTAHSHTATNITDFAEAVQDVVATTLLAGGAAVITYDDGANTITISAPSSGGLDAEGVRDAIGVALLGSGLISVSANDAADTITISTTATANSTDAALRDRSTHTGTQTASTISDLTESVQDIIGAVVSATGGITVTYTDASNTLVLSIADAALTIAKTSGLQAALDGRSLTGHTHVAANISDSTAVGRAVLTAVDQAAARLAIGAVTLGTTSSTAMPGDTEFSPEDISAIRNDTPTLLGGIGVGTELPTAGPGKRLYFLIPE